MLVIFAAKDFQSGQTITFKVYKLDGTLIQSKDGEEIGTLGVYCCDVNPGAVRDAICIAENSASSWKAFRYIGRG